MTIDLKTTPFSGPSFNNNEQVQLLIASAKEAMDSIDLAYTNLRSSIRFIDLSLDDREKINEALQAMNNTKELIILETQKQMIDELTQKSLLLKNVVNEINAKSGKMKSICLTISHISNIIKKTTDLFAAALTAGVIKPKMN